MRPRHPWRTGAAVGALLGIAVAAFMMAAAWDHNPQGEFHDESGVAWGYWLGLGLTWFVPVFVFTTVAIGLPFAVLGKPSAKRG